MAAGGETRSKTAHRTPSQVAAQATGYNARPDQEKKRAERNKARREMEKAGRVAKGDGLEVDHKTSLRNGGSNSTSNMRVVSRKVNREKGDKNV